MKTLSIMGSYFLDPATEKPKVSSRRVNMFLCLVASVVFFAVSMPVAGGAFLAASVGDAALTLGGRHG